MRAGRDGWRVAAAVLVANALYVGGTFLVLHVAASRGIPADHLLRDPLAVVVAPLHIGLLSNVNVLVWCLGAGASLLAAAVLLPQAETRRPGRLLLGVGLLTLVLAADDLLLVHEGIAPSWFGVDEDVVLITYGLLAAALLVLHRDVVLGMGARWVLLLAAAAFAGSIAVDLFGGTLVFRPEEDLLKAVGVWNWSLAWGLASVQLVRRALSAPRPRDAVPA